MKGCLGRARSSNRCFAGVRAGDHGSEGEEKVEG